MVDLNLHTDLEVGKYQRFRVERVALHLPLDDNGDVVAIDVLDLDNDVVSHSGSSRFPRGERRLPPLKKQSYA